MFRNILGAALGICIVVGTAASASAAGTVGNYHSYSTDYPVQGFVGVGRKSGYCDYIKYPIKHCAPHRVCKRGKCWTVPSCKFVGWDVRQTCY